MGRIKGGVHLVTNVEDVDRLQVRDQGHVAYVTQTTLSVDDTREIIEALKIRFPSILGPDVRDICYATQNRQQAVRNIVSEVDVMLVVGAQNSSNSNRLREIGDEYGVLSYLIDDANSLDLEWLAKAQTVGVSAGASAPEELLDELIEKLRQNFDIKVRKFEGVEENVQFKLPPEITEAKSEIISLTGGN